MIHQVNILMQGTLLINKNF